MKTIYFISGLGVDERAFQFLNLEGFEVRYITWIDPNMGESLRAYCQRLLVQIDQNEEVNLVGLSFGGIVAQEIAKLIKVRRLIIISSIKSPEELSRSLKLVKKLRLNRLVPSRMLKWSNLVTGDYFFGTRSKQESRLLREIIQDTDEGFLVWAIEAIMRWENKMPDHNIIHIHGDHDRIFPMKNIETIRVIKKGGHFMIVSQAEEISEILKQNLI